jgi:hypothetical protein
MAKGLVQRQSPKDIKPGPEALQAASGATPEGRPRLGELTHVLATQQYQQLLDSREFQHFIIYSNRHRHVHPADLIP